MSHSSVHGHHYKTPQFAHWGHGLLKAELVLLILLAGGSGIAIAWFALTQGASPDPESSPQHSTTQGWSEPSAAPAPITCMTLAQAVVVVDANHCVSLELHD
jgi:hypothetical protein